jgi:hypothetical protein
MRQQRVRLQHPCSALTGSGGPVHGLTMFAMAAAVSVFVPSAHEIFAKFERSSRILAIAAGAVAALCLLAAGQGAPQTCIYFQF